MAALMEIKTRITSILVGDKMLIAADAESDRTNPCFYLPPAGPFAGKC